ncbi:UNVERIFIED_CONTAM: hypothetical protein FKN15_069178 [Acipenser sinensis]
MISGSETAAVGAGLWTSPHDLRQRNCCSGSRSLDPPPRSPAAKLLQWEQVSGPPPMISGSETAAVGAGLQTSPPFFVAGSSLLWGSGHKNSCSETAAGESGLQTFSPFFVSQESIHNKMTPSNLACVFGLNLIWPPRGTASFGALMPLNMFTELLIEHYSKVFSSRTPPSEVLP